VGVVFKLIGYLVVILVIAYLGSTVKLGKRTLFGHIQAIWASPEANDLKEGVKETAGPAVDKIKRGAEAGIKAIHEGSAAEWANGSAGSGSAGSGSAAPAHATP